MLINKKSALLQKRTKQAMHILRNSEESFVSQLCRELLAENKLLRTENQILREENAMLQEENAHDEMTGVLEKTVFKKRVIESIVKAYGPCEYVAIFTMDMDGFKYINDTYGHFVGDLVLTLFCSALKSVFRHNDLIGRMGGDEFAVSIHIRRNVTQTTPATTSPSSTLDDYKEYLERAYALSQARMRSIQGDLIAEVAKNLRLEFPESTIGDNLSVSCAYCIFDQHMQSVYTNSEIPSKNPLDSYFISEPKAAQEKDSEYGLRIYEAAYKAADVFTQEYKSHQKKIGNRPSREHT